MKLYGVARVERNQQRRPRDSTEEIPQIEVPRNSQNL